jgi:hypothetical protein
VVSQQTPKNGAAYPVPRRGISSEFKDELRKGKLQPILELVRHDDTLSLEIRNGYVDIYYRGGLLLGLTEQALDSFSCHFDEQYLGHDAEYRLECPAPPPAAISTVDHAVAWLQIGPSWSRPSSWR